MGTAAGVTNFCGLHANVHGKIKQVVHGVAGDLLARIDRLGGLNEPHLVLGKTCAQAYDTAVYKCAADDLLLSRNVSIVFHAFAAGVVMDDPGRIKARTESCALLTQPQLPGPMTSSGRSPRHHSSSA